MFANHLKLNADKTELLWAGLSHAFAVLGSSGLRLSDESVTPSDHAHIVGITISSVLSLDKHISSVAAKCFYSLR